MDKIAEEFREQCRARRKHELELRKKKESDIKKSASEKDNNRTTIMKDRVMPAFRSEGHAAKGALVAGVAGAALGATTSIATGKGLKMAAKKLGGAEGAAKHLQTAAKKLGASDLESKGLQIAAKRIAKSDKAQKAYQFATSPEMKKTRIGLSAATTAVSAIPKGARTGRVLGDINDLGKQSRKELGREPSEKEYARVARLNPDDAFDRKLGRLVNSPKAMVKSNARNINKSASDTLEDMYKEAALVTHASKAVNGLGRAAQLVTGSHAKGLKKSLKTLNNTPAGSFKDSVEVGNKIMSTQKALNTEIGKVKKARMATAGTVGTIGAIGTGISNRKGNVNANN